VHGSAEVVGVMCLRVFCNEDRRPHDPVREPGTAALQAAQALGAAFQKVNFLRDLGADGHELGRVYLPGAQPGRLDAAARAAVLADVAGDLRTARAGLRELPVRARCAVAVSLGLYEELVRRLAAQPADQLGRDRVRVPGPAKAGVAARALVRTLAGVRA
jgi:phytoene/squalene synthetase